MQLQILSWACQIEGAGTIIDRAEYVFPREPDTPSKVKNKLYPGTKCWGVSKGRVVMVNAEDYCVVIMQLSATVVDLIVLVCDVDQLVAAS